MKRLLFVLPLYCCELLHAQGAHPDFAAIDRFSSGIEAPNAYLLSSRLCEPFHTDLEKTRAIFSWIAQHVSYYTKPSFLSAARLQRPISTTGTAQITTGGEDVAAEVLSSRVAICNGYARLFQTLCEYGRIPVVLITGYASPSPGQYRGKFTANHYWNAVYTDSAWHLVDVTWSSGYMSYNGLNFIPNFDDHYFYTDPEEFSIDHFPDDLNWLLADAAHIPSEFSRSPFRQRSFIKYHFTGFAPQTGTLEAAEGDTLHFAISTSDFRADRRIFPDTLSLDSIMQSPFNIFLYPVDTSGADTVLYDYVVNAGQARFVHLVYQKDVVLRYRLKIRRFKVASR